MSTTGAIQIIVNGQSRTTAAGQTVAGLLAELGLKPQRLAIELDRQIVKQADWPATVLRDGARVEIVQFVGGG